LRAASYGPSPQQLRDREKSSTRGDAPFAGKDGLSTPRPKRAPHASARTEVLQSETKAERAPRVKKTLGDSESQDRKASKKSFADSPKKLSRHILTRSIDNDEDVRVRSVASFKRAQKKRFVQKIEPAKVSRDVVIPDTITVGDLSNRMAVSSATVIKALMKLGTLASINQVIDGDTAELICVEFGHRPKRTSADDLEIGLKRGESAQEELHSRPPVITVMGHVDHGKTSLLDALRKTNIIATECGGITQKIGAYQIVTPYSSAKITFFDTPGHAAFSEMRARGANVTDIVVLVVAADDGINAQTLEAISHAKAAKAPIIVAINKIDKPTADPQRAKNELLNHDVILEDFGGDVMSVDISAKVGTNLDKLVEAILLQSEILELKASPEGPAEGVIVEASVQKGRGIVATILVQKGTLRVGDIFVAGAEFGRIKIMSDYLGNKVLEAGPSCPVEVIGFSGSPLAGDDFVVVNSEQRARDIADHRKQVRKEKDALIRNKNSVEHMMTQIASGESNTLNIVVKADTQGSLEAIKSNIMKLSVDGVTVQVVHGAIGDINESDIALAKSSSACVVGFGVKATPQARLGADRDGVSIGYYTIIYEMLEQIELMMKGQLAPTFEERVLGRADLRVVFTKGKFIKIAGCYVISGLIRRSNSQIRVLRGNAVVFTGKIESMKHEQDDIKESKEGHECGLILDGFNDIKQGDIIECFEIVEVKK
jgi:translation initiation factor IF-2